MKYGDRGSEVKAAQLALLERDPRALPKYGPDSHLGDETWAALERFSKGAGIGWRPSVPAETLAALSVAPEPPGPTPPPPGPVPVLDLRHEQSDPAPKSKVVNGKTVQRPPETVTAICIHQTACTFGVSQQQINAAGGDRALALHRRALGVACHAMAFMDGTVVIANKLPAYIQHAGPLNSISVGLECEGRLPGLTNDPDGTTWGGEPTPLTETMINAAREAVRQLVELAAESGIKITHIYTHRQSSESRRSDCGEGLWRAVVLDYAVPVLGLRTSPGLTFGSGQPVPVEWDPNGVGHY